MKNQLSFLFTIAVLFGYVQQAKATDTTDTGRVSAVVELSDVELQSLLQTGKFKMSIPHRLKNKVNSLILKRPDRFKDDVAVLFNDVDKRSNTIAISVDDSTIEQIAYQPVELKIYESGYTNIMVRYQPGNGKRNKKPSKTDSVELMVSLKNGKSITGRLSYMPQFPLKSGLGKVKVKLAEVSQVTFEDDGDLRVTMFNGDTLQGESNFSSIIVNSRWGQERIKTKDIASITPPLSMRLPTVNTMIPSQPFSYGGYGQPTQDNSAVSVMPEVSVVPPMSNSSIGQAFEHQFPMETGRIDTLPRSHRHTQNYMLPQPVQTYNSYGGYGQYGVPVQNGIIYNGASMNGVPLNGVPKNEVPVSMLPVIDSMIGQPLPLMTPNQANENWLFP